MILILVLERVPHTSSDALEAYTLPLSEATLLFMVVSILVHKSTEGEPIVNLPDVTVQHMPCDETFMGAFLPNPCSS